MIKFGTEPFLECSSKGDKRFSAFYAKVELSGRADPIELYYQVAKCKELGIDPKDWRKAKGRKVENIEDLRRYYSFLWDKYFQQNPELIEVIKQYNGFSDIFGQKGHACQAEEIHRIRMETNHDK